MPPPTASLDQMINDLLTDNVDVRRLTRERLAEFDPEIIPTLMRAVKKNPQNYRMNVGVATVISGMLHRGKPARSVAAQLTPEDLKIIEQWVLTGDSALRSPSAGILALTSDIDTLKKMTTDTSNSGDPEALYYASWVLSNRYRRFLGDQQSMSEIKGMVAELRNRALGTDALILLNKVPSE